jgi:hypothetical protein
MLTPSVVNIIETEIDKVFDDAKARFLGKTAAGKRMMFSIIKDLTLPAVFENAAVDEGGVPEIATLNSIIVVANNYLESAKSKAKAEVVAKIQAFVDQSKFSEENETVLRKEITDSLVETWKTVTTNLETIVDAETQKTKNISLLDGIVRMNAVQEVNDPVVFWIVTRMGKNHPCDECAEIHLMGDRITPRLWKMSEVSYGYHVRGDDSPCVSGLHPHCMCTLTTLLPGYGFTAGGRVTYIKDGHDELSAQRA